MPLAADSRKKTIHREQLSRTHARNVGSMNIVSFPSPDVCAYLRKYQLITPQITSLSLRVKQEIENKKSEIGNIGNRK